ncbi:MAG TPA: hypothetical protein PKD64_02945 [Pirellulaceae bacterium]|nr:hypothetical protein [Pirellulaceae bacterium]HMO91126.1 hypothetical protein [Pirellulaceae bacterium]HMP71066.1 hypothetical protein [Pirellulaceae bacterium]
MNRFQGPVTLGHVVEAVWHQKLRFVLVFIAVMLLVAIAFLYTPRRYGSEGVVFVQLGRQNVGLDPTTTTSGTITVNDSRETEIRSILEMIQSQQLLAAAVDQVGAQRIIDGTFNIGDLLTSLIPQRGTVDESLGMSAEDYATYYKKEKAIKRVHSAMKVENEKKSTVIRVSVKANSPGLARDLVDSIMQTYKEMHVKINQVKARTFFEEQFEAERGHFEQALNKLRDFRSSREFLSVEGARNTLQRVIDTLQEQLVQVGVDLAQAQERERRLEASLTDLDLRIDTPTIGVERASAEGTNTEFVRLQSELAKLLISKKDTHHRVIELKSQIEQLENTLNIAPEDRTVTTQNVNPVYQQVESSLIEASAAVNALERKQQQVKQEIENTKVTLRQLNEDVVVSEKLERDVEVRRAYLDTYAKKRGEATILDQLDEEKISNLVVTPASLMLRHVSPRGSIVLPVGALFALFVATVSCFLTHRTRQQAIVERPEDLEQEFALPVLISLPRVPATSTSVR